MYDRDTSTHLSSVKAFESSVIHGLVAQDASCSETLVLAWAGQSICLLKISAKVVADSSATVGILSTFGNAILCDWVLDATFRTNPRAARIFGQDARPNEPVALVATAHSALFQIQIDETKELAAFNKPLEIQQRSEKTTSKGLHGLSAKQLTTGSRTICYSTHLKWLSDNTVLLAVGTAFGDIALTVYLLDGDASEIQASATFLGHEGSIFGIRISDPISFHSLDLPIRLLASCSDDRTIRVWDITDVCKDATSELRDRGRAEKNTSGFRSHSEPDTDHGNVPLVRCIASSMGHLSRVWSVNFVPDVSKEQSKPAIIKLASVGEDATCLLWGLSTTSLDGPPGPILYNLRQLDVPITHFGKNIWSLSNYSTPSPIHQTSIVTGGADGAIQMHTIELASDSERSGRRIQWLVNANSGEIVISSPPFGEEYTKRSPSSEDLVRSYAFLRGGSFIFTTNSGTVFVARRTQGRVLEESIYFTQLGVFKDLSGYSVAVGLPNQNLTFFAGASGIVRCYDGSTDQISDICTTSSSQKVSRLFAQHIEKSFGHEWSIVLVITFVKHEFPQLVFLQRHDTGAWTVTDDLALRLSPLILNKEVTSALTIVNDDGQLQCFGLRDGRILLARFNLRNPAGNFTHDVQPTSPDGFAAIRAAHGNDAVTSAKWIQDRAGNGGWLYSSGRDGTIAIHRLNSEMTDITLVHQLPIPLGKDLEGLYVDEHHGELLVYGFHSVKFALHDVVKSEEVISSNCGGAHRTWEFDIHVSPESGESTGGTLLWTKVSKSNLDAINKPKNCTVRPGFHGREVKTAAISQGSAEVNGFGPLVATGAEDTDIRLFTYAKNEDDSISEGSFRSVATIRKHNTGLQSLKWSKSGDYLFSSGGFEEFFIWKINRVPILEVGVVCESSLPVSSKLSEQRVSDFVVREIQTTDKSATEFHISMICSNSSIKTYRYFGDKFGRTWTLLSQAQYTTSCLNVINHIHLESLSFVCITGTDGRVTIWKDYAQGGKTDVDEDTPEAGFSLVGRVSLHQGSIKTTSAIQLSQSAVVILSGGDDNAIGITLLRRPSDQGSISTSSILIPRAHAASVTTSTVFSLVGSQGEAEADPDKFRLRAVTSGNDQRLKVWDIGIDLSLHGAEGIEVRKIATKSTAVADASSIAVFPRPDRVRTMAKSQPVQRLLVIGVGAEIWKLSIG